jgi:hypothetical protein
MATLAKGLQISQPVIGRIVVKVRGRQHYPGWANCELVTNSSNKATSASIAPGLFVFIPPSTIAQMPDLTAMRPAAPLAPALGSLEPDQRRKLRPVDGIKPFVLGADRHRRFWRRADSLAVRSFGLFAIRVNADRPFIAGAFQMDEPLSSSDLAIAAIAGLAAAL